MAKAGFGLAVNLSPNFQFRNRVSRQDLKITNPWAVRVGKPATEVPGERAFSSSEKWTLVLVTGPVAEPFNANARDGELKSGRAPNYFISLLVDCVFNLFGLEKGWPMSFNYEIRIWAFKQCFTVLPYCNSTSGVGCFIFLYPYFHWLALSTGVAEQENWSNGESCEKEFVHLDFLR